MEVMGIQNAVQPETATAARCDQCEVGILKKKNTDVIFSQFPENFFSFDNMVLSSPYQLFPKTSIPSRSLEVCPFPESVLEQERWQEDFYQPILHILEEANQKRLELYSLLIKNPSFPWHKTKATWITRLYYSIMVPLAEIPLFGSLLVWIGSILIGFPLFLINIAQSFCFYVMDCLFCRLSCCRGTEKEKLFLSEIIQAHPSLDTIQIDEEIQQKLQQLSTKLSEKYSPHLKIGFRNGQEQIVDEMNADFYMQDYFLLTLDISGSYRTEAVSMV
jgi:hypothetical protein